MNLLFTDLLSFILYDDINERGYESFKALKSKGTDLGS